MNKNEFLHDLSHALSGLSRDEQADILADYNEHFLIGTAEGRSEREISIALGDPRSIGREYAALSLVKRAESDPSARGLSHAVIATVGSWPVQPPGRFHPIPVTIHPSFGHPCNRVLSYLRQVRFLPGTQFWNYPVSSEWVCRFILWPVFFTASA